MHEGIPDKIGRPEVGDIVQWLQIGSSVSPPGSMFLVLLETGRFENRTRYLAVGPSGTVVYIEFWPDHGWNRGWRLVS